jgi:hypothetical protein
MSTQAQYFLKYLLFLHPLNSAVYPQEESQTTSVIAYISSAGSPTESPPIAFPGLNLQYIQLIVDVNLYNSFLEQ